MLTILIRAVLLYFILTLSMRAMGKRQLGQFQPYEFVMAMLIANLVALPMSDISTPLLHGVLPVAALSICTRYSPEQVNTRRDWPASTTLCATFGSRTAL